MEFTIKDAVQITGNPREKIRDWANRGFIKASIQEAKGKGTQNIYSLNDLYGIKLFECLIEKGISRKIAAYNVKVLLSEIENCGEDFWRDSSNNLYAAFFQRDNNNRTMTGRNGRYLTKDGKFRGKAISPELRIIKNKDIQKTFATLFLNFNDDPVSDEYDVPDFQAILIVNVRDVKNAVDMMVTG
jgi:hypothetical protein